MSDGSREAALPAAPAQRCPFLGRILETPAAKARDSWGQSLEDGDHRVASADVLQPDPPGVPPSTPRDTQDPDQDKAERGGGVRGGPDPHTPCRAGSGAAALLPGRSCLVILLLFASFLLPRQGLLCFPGVFSLLCFQMGSEWGDDGGCPQPWP